jgi:formate/nitrite transporter
MWLGNSLTRPSALRSPPRLTIFNTLNEKDAFAASLPETQDAATIEVGHGSNLPRRSRRRCFLDYVQPTDLLSDATKAASRKASLSVRDLLIRSFLAGGLLAYATSLVFIVLSQNVAPIVGAILFPVGFVILVLLGLELATGNFALLPIGWAAGEVSFPGMLRNLGWVYLGNLAGSLFYALLFYLAVTNCGTGGSGVVGELMKSAAQKKTIAYMAIGLRGWETAFIKGVLCNWMVTLGAVLAMASRSTIGKVVAMWLPIMTFFAHGYEHSIVNMFLIPTGKLFGAPISLGQWWVWNQIPVTLGNFVSGVLLTGLALYVTNMPKKAATMEISLGTAETARVAAGQVAEAD